MKPNRAQAMIRDDVRTRAAFQRKYVPAVALFVMCLLMSGSRPAVALAQGTPQYKVDVRLTYWPTHVTASTPTGQFGNWNSGLWGLEVNVSPRASRWGFGASYETGSQSNGGGNWLSLQSGTDRIWSAWVNFALLPRESQTQLNLWLGYGEYAWDARFVPQFFNATSETFRSYGVMVGISYDAPLGRNVDFGGTVMYFPSNYTSLQMGGFYPSSGSSTASVWDFRANIQVELGSCAARGGYRWANARAGNVSGCQDCEFRWSGPYFNLIYKF